MLVDILAILGLFLDSDYDMFGPQPRFGGLASTCSTKLLEIVIGLFATLVSGIP